MKNILFLFLVILIFNSCQKEINSEISDDNLNLTNATYYEHSHLTFNGGQLWYGSFGGEIAWFEGASPTEIQNGMRSAWTMTVPPDDPEKYYRHGVTSFGGNRTGIHLSKIVLQNDEIKITMKKVIKQDDGSYKMTNFTRTVKQFGAGSEAKYSGKIILDQNCSPVIVDISSDMPSGCFEDDDNGPLLPL